MKSLKPRVIPLLLLLILSALSFQASAEEMLWKSGKNQYIKLTEQDETASGERPEGNDHPVELDRNAVTNALTLMQIWNENYIRDNEVIRVLSTQQARLLGENIAKGLREARPDQDIVFALAKKERGFLSIESVEYMAGRVFYANGKLNLIIGDYAKPADRFKERMYQSHGMGDEVQYYFTHGKRAKSVGFKENVMNKEGIRQNRGRNDWFLIDVDVASQTYQVETREQRQEQEGTTRAVEADTEAFRREAARLDRERREMRLEMARMRKELKEAQKGNNLSVEERLKKLEDLKNQGLITEEEYRDKRQAILDEL